MDHIDLDLLKLPSISRAARVSEIHSTSTKPKDDDFLDCRLPRRLFSAVTIDGKHREIVRGLDDTERQSLHAREADLEACLHGYFPEESRSVMMKVTAMFGGFRFMRETGKTALSEAEVTCHILREYPLWAITQGCRDICYGEAGLDPRYAPNDAEIHTVMGRIVGPYRKALARTKDLLSAPVEKPVLERLTTEQIAEKIGRPFAAERPAQVSDAKPPHWGKGNLGGHMQRVLAELAERKRQRDAEGDGAN